MHSIPQRRLQNTQRRFVKVRSTISIPEALQQCEGILLCDRLHYEPWELCLFENIECQWPLFYCFLVINGCFSGKEEEVRKFSKALDRCIIWQDGVPLVPELYALPKDQDKGSR